jgi:hypothetical protein
MDCLGDLLWPASNAASSVMSNINGVNLVPNSAFSRSASACFAETSEHAKALVQQKLGAGSSDRGGCAGND